ncbi:NAD/ferredoxin-dependent reductase-like protein [Kribbella sp. VKM Ac-2527]|uniref:NAD/ferredoxin-dependent reductase-like protein n=1 Tax=Kribbella caucasensis TaxID=2512215 RepID=A0A4R6KHN5_9ACTN|nr:NAD/ferredoxin-dependent reductase-like protein [Kribbella sp. VKM Ac-2527]
MVIGGGFVGLEVASTAAQLGLSVTVVEPQAVPLERLLGRDIGGRVAALHERNGVRILAPVSARRVLGRGKVEAVELADGEVVTAHIVVVAIGSVPNSDWLAMSAIDVTDGVLCDEYCRVVGVRDVFAVGDVARRRRPQSDDLQRIEHWTNAVAHADVAAKAILGLGQGPNYAALPYFWSDQFDVKLQFVGTFNPRQVMTIDGSSAQGRNRSITVFGDGRRVVGALAWNWPAAIGRTRRLLERSTVTMEVVEEAFASPWK